MALEVGRAMGKAEVFLFLFKRSSALCWLGSRTRFGVVVRSRGSDCTTRPMAVLLLVLEYRCLAGVISLSFGRFAESLARSVVKMVSMVASYHWQLCHR